MSFPFVSGSFLNVLMWVLQNKYPIIFVAMVIEGPIIIAAASFAAKMGYFSLPIIFILAILGDIVGDFIWFGLGYFSRINLVNKFGHRFGLSQERMNKLKDFFEKNPVKALAVIKISPFLPVPGLILAGSSHMSVKKFAGVISLIILPKTILFMVVGYFFGSIYDKISGYLSSGIYAIALFILLIFIINYFFRSASVKLSQKIEEEIEEEKK